MESLRLHQTTSGVMIITHMPLLLANINTTALLLAGEDHVTQSCPLIGH